MLERDIQTEILKVWGSHPRLRIWRQNTGAMRLDSRFIRFGVKGCADILGLISPSGRFLAIECKTKTGKQTPEQQTFERVISQWGGLYVLARSLSDVDSAFAAIGITR